MRAPPQRIKKYCILGLDPSVTNFGMAWVTAGGALGGMHTITTKKLQGMPRVAHIVELVKGTVGTLMGEHSRVVVAREDYAYASHSSSDAVLKELGGVLEWELYKMGVSLYKVGVSQVKKVITGKGNSEKDQMMLCVYKNFGVDPVNEHQADAFGVAFTSFLLLSKAGKTAAQREVIDAAIKTEHPLTRIDW